MGYRLEISKLEHADCGGKLFGYIEDEELHECKSWQWLKEHGYLDKSDEDLWSYGFSHGAKLWHDDYEEFIKLYIEDYNRYYKDYPITVDKFKESLDADCVYIEWG